MPFPNAGVVNLATRSGVVEYVFAKLDTLQNANISANDHVKFDTVLASRGGAVTLDTTTAFSAATGAASIGRFTLRANVTYKLTASIPYILGTGATTLLDVQWFDATLNAALPGSIMTMLAASGANDIGGGLATAIFTPGADTLVELRLITVTAFTQIGTATREPWALVEAI
jgi:hypothetical protein